jgi:hypothetical protein
MPYKKAERVATLLRMSIIGPSGSGKTRTALKIMRDIVKDAGQILVIDTEISAPGHGASEMYDEYDHYVLRGDEMVDNLPFWTPTDLKDAMQEAVDNGINGIIVDSFTDEWVNYLAWKNMLNDTYSNTVKPAHVALMKWIENCPVHIILCLRAREKGVWSETKDGKKGRILHMAEQADGAPDFKFYTMLSLNLNNTETATVVKSRYEEIPDGAEYPARLDEDGNWVENFTDVLLTALDKGAKTKQRFMLELRKRGYSTPKQLKALAKNIDYFGKYSQDRHDDMLTMVDAYIAQQADEDPVAESA